MAFLIDNPSAFNGTLYLTDDPRVNNAGTLVTCECNIVSGAMNGDVEVDGTGGGFVVLNQCPLSVLITMKKGCTVEIQSYPKCDDAVRFIVSDPVAFIPV